MKASLNAFLDVIFDKHEIGTFSPKRHSDVLVSSHRQAKFQMQWHVILFIRRFIEKRILWWKTHHSYIEKNEKRIIRSLKNASFAPSEIGRRVMAETASMPLQQLSWFFDIFDIL